MDKEKQLELKRWKKELSKEIISRSRNQEFRDKLDVLLKDFTAPQIEYMEFLANPQNKVGGKTVYDKLHKEFEEKVDVNKITLWRWKNLPGFREAVNLLSMTYSLDDLPDIITSMARAAKSGNVSAAKLWLQIHGLLPEDNKVDVKQIQATIIPKSIDELIGMG